MFINERNPHRPRRCRGNRWILCVCLTVIFCPILSTPTQADTEVGAVSNLLKAGEYLAALTLLEDLKPLRPCDVDLLFLEARIYETAGETDRAIALYESLIEFFPGFPEPYNNLAALYGALGQIQRAEALLLKGLATHDTYRQLQTNLSRIYVARAAQAYRKALNIEAPSGSTSVSSSTLLLLDSEAVLHFQPKVSTLSVRECNPSINAP